MHSIKSFLKRYLIWVLLLSSYGLWGQSLGPRFFTDPVPSRIGAGGEAFYKTQSGFFFGGTTFNDYGKTAFLSYWDSTGALQWNTADYDTSFYQNPFWTYEVDLKQIVADEDYAYAYVDYYYPLIWEKKQIWKIRLLDGEILWKYDFKAHLDAQIYVADDQHLVLVRDSLWWGVNSYDFNFGLINTTNGQLIQEVKNIENLAPRFAVDSSGIYFADGKTVTKLSLIDLNDTIWSEDIVSTSNFMEVNNTTGKLYAVNVDGNLLQLDPSTGSFISKVPSGCAWGQELMDLAQVGDELILAFGYTTGNTSSRWTLGKFDLNSLTHVWSALQTPEGIGIEGTQAGDGVSGSNECVSIDVDAHGDVYAMGFIKNGNPCIAKYSGQSGQLLFEKTLATDSSQFSNLGYGLGVAIWGDRLFGVGKLYEDSDIFFINGNWPTSMWKVSLDTTSGTIIDTFEYRHDYQYPSHSIQFLPSGTDMVHVYQQGMDLHVAKFDQNLQLLWDEKVAAPYGAIGQNAAINDLGQVAVFYHNFNLKERNPYYVRDYQNNPQSQYWILSPNGQTLRQDSIAGNWGLDILGIEGLGNKFIVIDAGNFAYELSTSGHSLKYIGASDEAVQNGIPDIIYHDPVQNRMLVLSDQSQVLGSIGRLYAYDPVTFQSLGRISDSDLYRVKGLATHDTLAFIAGMEPRTTYDRLSLARVDMEPTFNNSVFEWIQVYSIYASPERLLYGPDGFLYLAANGTDFTEEFLSVFKINPTTGAIVWQSDYKGISTGRDRPLDMLYHEATDQLIIAGDSKEITPSVGIEYASSFLIRMDTSGTINDTVRLEGDYHGDNFAPVLSQNTVGLVFWGGNWNHNPQGKAGFWYAYDPACFDDGSPKNISVQMESSGGQALSNALLYLVQFDPTDSSLTAIDTLSADQWGQVSFTASYDSLYLKVAPDSALFPDELPTYYFGANLFVNANALHMDCDLAVGIQTIAGQNPGGPGFIGGKITQGANKKAGDPIGGISFFLKKNGTRDFIAADISDENGWVQFANLPLGTYEVWVDDPKVNNARAPMLILDAANSQQAYVSFLLHERYLEIGAFAVAIEPENYTASYVKIFPNPSKAMIQVKFDEPQERGLVRILDLNGRLKKQVSFRGNSLIIDRNEMASGIYFIEFWNNKELMHTDKLVWQ